MTEPRRERGSGDWLPGSGDNTLVPPLLRSLRPHQWTKNSFVFAPIVFARALTEGATLLAAISAFFIFCGLSSAVYLLNDLADRERDRLHPLKKSRPLAAGTLSVGAALAALAGLAVTSLAAAFFLGLQFLGLSLAYLALNLCYTLWLKRVVIVDVMTVSLGYVVRVMAGGAAIGVVVSAWLLLCTIFLALFLTASKRRHELLLLAETAAEQREVLGRYSLDFLDQMINVVTASSLLSYALYTTSPETVEKFGTRSLIYTIPFALFGIFRYLYLSYRVSDDRSPTEAMLTDLPFILNLAFWALAVYIILYWL